MTIAREEIFGPVAAVIPFKDAAETNDTEFGLASGVWTRDVGRPARGPKAGTVWINTCNVYDPAAPPRTRPSSPPLPERGGAM